MNVNDTMVDTTLSKLCTSCLSQHQQQCYTVWHLPDRFKLQPMHQNVHRWFLSLDFEFSKMSHAVTECDILSKGGPKTCSMLAQQPIHRFQWSEIMRQWIRFFWKLSQTLWRQKGRKQSQNKGNTQILSEGSSMIVTSGWLCHLGPCLVPLVGFFKLTSLHNICVWSYRSGCFIWM